MSKTPPPTRFPKKKGVYTLTLRDNVKSDYLEPEDIVAVDLKGRPITNPLSPFGPSVSEVVQKHQSVVNTDIAFGTDKLPLGTRFRFRTLPERWGSSTRGYGTEYEFKVVVYNKFQGIGQALRRICPNSGSYFSSRDGVLPTDDIEILSKETKFVPSPSAPSSIAQRLIDIQPVDIRNIHLEPFTFPVIKSKVSPDAVRKLKEIYRPFHTSIRVESFPSLSPLSCSLLEVSNLQEKETGLFPAWRAEARSWPGRFNRALETPAESDWTKQMRAAAESFLKYGLREEVWEEEPIQERSERPRVFGYYENCSCGDCRRIRGEIP